jgi:hypothetical protein
MGRGFRRFFEEIPKKIAQFSQISLYFFENFSYHEVAIRMEGSGSPAADAAAKAPERAFRRIRSMGRIVKEDYGRQTHDAEPVR